MELLTIFSSHFCQDQIRLETSKGGSDFNFDSVYKSDKIKVKHGGTIVPLNQEKNEWHLEVVSNIKPFLNNYNWEWISYHQKLNIGKDLEKIMQQFLSISFMLMKNKYPILVLQKLIDIEEDK